MKETEIKYLHNCPNCGEDWGHPGCFWRKYLELVKIASNQYCNDCGEGPDRFKRPGNKKLPEGYW